MNTLSTTSPSVVRASRRNRFSYLVITIVALLACVSLTSCDDDGPGYFDDWYLNGTYQNATNGYDAFTFYPDGTGYYETYDGGYMDFDYYCVDNTLYLTMYPSYGPAYDLDCMINYYNDNYITITFPPGNNFGYTTIQYRRVY